MAADPRLDLRVNRRSGDGTTSGWSGITKPSGGAERLEGEQDRRVTIWVSEDDGALAGLWDGVGLAYDTLYNLNVGVGINSGERPGARRCAGARPAPASER